VSAAPPAVRGARFRDLSRAGRARFVGLALVVALPFAVAAVAAGQDDWRAVGDDAVILVGAEDVGGARTPILGMTTTSDRFAPGVVAYHPGPLVFWVQAPFVSLLGDTVGLLAGTALVTATAAVLIGYVGLRIGGLGTAVGAWVGALLVTVMVGGGAFLYRPFNASIVTLPALLFLFSSWAVASRRFALAPIWVLSASFVVQSEVQWAPIVAAVSVLTLGFAVTSRWRARPAGATGPRPWPDRVPLRALLWAPLSAPLVLLIPAVRDGGLQDAAVGLVVAAALAPPLVLLVAGAVPAGRRLGGALAPTTRRGWLGLATTGVVILLAWSGPLVEAGRDDGGNFVQLVEAVTESTAEPRGFGPALFDAGTAVLLDPADTQFATLTPLEVVVAAFLTVAAAALVVTSWSRTGAEDRRLVALAATGVAAGLISSANVPDTESYQYHRLLPLAVVIGFAWYAVARVGLARRRTTVRSPRPTTPGTDPSTRALRVGTVAVIGLTVVACVPVPVAEGREHGAWTFAATDVVAGQLDEPLPEDGTVQVVALGPRGLHLVRDGLAAQLEDRGVHTSIRRSPGIDAPGSREEEGDPPAGVVLVVPSESAPPPGWTHLAAYRPTDGDGDAAAVATDIAAFARETGATLLPIATGTSETGPGLGAVICPALVTGQPETCDEPLPSPDEAAVGDLPPWVVALLYAEQFDPHLPSEVMRTETPPAELLARVREHFTDIAFDVYGSPVAGAS
jgi:hypothetical protein